MRLNLKRLAPVTALTAAAAAAVLIPAFAAVSLTSQRPQVTIAPTVIGSVFNGGTSVVVSNDPPVGSGNVIDSP